MPRDKVGVFPQVACVLPNPIVQGCVLHEVGILVLLHDLLLKLEVSKRVLDNLSKMGFRTARSLPFCMASYNSLMVSRICLCWASIDGSPTE